MRSGWFCRSYFSFADWFQPKRPQQERARAHKSDIFLTEPNVCFWTKFKNASLYTKVSAWLNELKVMMLSIRFRLRRTILKMYTTVSLYGSIPICFEPKKSIGYSFAADMSSLLVFYQYTQTQYARTHGNTSSSRWIQRNYLYLTSHIIIFWLL